MSEPRFIPLTCPRCQDDLVGRAADRLAFCPRCAIAVRIARDGLVEIDVRSVSAIPDGDGLPVRLPFWCAGSTAVPAFQSARPLTLTRIASRLVARWPTEPTLLMPLPLGARHEAHTMTRIAALARVPPPPPGAPLFVLSVPLRFHGNRARLPRFEGTLFPEDIGEVATLVEMAGEMRERVRTR